MDWLVANLRLSIAGTWVAGPQIREAIDREIDAAAKSAPKIIFGNLEKKVKRSIDIKAEVW
jgi:hypothetical protein